MEKSRLLWLPLVLSGFVMLMPARSDVFDVQDLGPKIFQAEWVSVNKLPEDPSSLIPFPWGNDPLSDGEIEVRAKGQVKVELEDALPEVTYKLWVCKLSNVADRCAELGPVMTDGRGRANAIVPWPEGATGPHAVFFVLSRDGTSMFVSGFHMPAGVPPVTGIPSTGSGQPKAPKLEWEDNEVEINGEVASVGGNSFLLHGITLTILVNDDTRYLGRLTSFQDLRPGIKVEVKGEPNGSGAVLALRVKGKK